MGSGTKRNLAYRSNAVRKAWGADPNNRPAQRATTELSRAYFGISMMVVSLVLRG